VPRFYPNKKGCFRGISKIDCVAGSVLEEERRLVAQSNYAHHDAAILMYEPIILLGPHNGL